MRCHKHRKRPAVAVCLHCGVGVCQDCLEAARRDADKVSKHGGCQHGDVATHRGLHQVRDQLRLLTRVQSLLCILAGGPFLGLAVVVYWVGATMFSVMIGIISVIFTGGGIVMWRREIRLYRCEPKR